MSARDLGGGASEPATSRDTSSGGPTRLAWLIHWGALLLLVVLCLVVFWDELTGPPRGSPDLEAWGTRVVAMFLVSYAFVTTVLMVWLSQRTLGPIVLHLLGFGWIFGAMWLDGDL